MAERRLFYLPEAIAGVEPVALPADEAHHVAHVLRLGAGERFGILDGLGNEGTAEIVSVHRGSVLVRVLTLGPGAREPRRTVVLAAALLRGPRWDSLIEKATELGATIIVPLLTDRCVVKGGRGERWGRIALAAAKQSLRARVPEVVDPRRLPDVLADWRHALILVAEEGGGPPGPAPEDPKQPLLLLVGPEGGLTEDESRLLGAQGARGVGLGPRRLRSETAAAALLSIARPLFDAPGPVPGAENYLDTGRESPL